MKKNMYSKEKDRNESAENLSMKDGLPAEQSTDDMENEMICSAEFSKGCETFNDKPEQEINRSD